VLLLLLLLLWEWDDVAESLVFLAGQGQNWMGTGARSGEGEVGDEIESRAEEGRQKPPRNFATQGQSGGTWSNGARGEPLNQPYSFPALQFSYWKKSKINLELIGKS
jgi:hypothetical protein